MKISIVKLTSACLLAIGSITYVNAQQINEKELKINVNKISNSAARIKAIEPVTFQYNTAKYKSLDLPIGNQYGFLASNVEGVFPEMIKESSKIYSSGKNSTKVAKYDAVNASDLIPLLVAAMKEQQEQIEKLQQEVESLKAK